MSAFAPVCDPFGEDKRGSCRPSGQAGDDPNPFHDRHQGRSDGRFGALPAYNRRAAGCRRVHGIMPVVGGFVVCG
ncbi:MAG: hypothetical protein AMXMBFR83_17910 [Phycisphaerae bacterium]